MVLFEGENLPAMASTVIKKIAIFQVFLGEGALLKQPLFMLIFHQRDKKDSMFASCTKSVLWDPNRDSLASFVILLNSVSTRNRTKRAKNDIEKYRTL